MQKEIVERLRQIIGSKRLDLSREERACYSYDGTGRIFLPEAVVFPENSKEICQILQLANEFHFPVTARGAGSGMTGGSLPVQGGLVLAMAGMDKILEIDPKNMVAVVEPGVITGELQKEVQQYGLYYPPDPASLNFCTIGGNAAECAGGPSAVKYGVTKDYIIGLEVILPTGEIMQTGVRTEKGVVGYDLTRLFIGSEGTLGIFTKLIVRLVPLPECRKTFLLSFSSIADATELVADILSAGILPCTLEYMDERAIAVVADRLTTPPPSTTKALLLVEIDGTNKEVAKQKKILNEFLQARHIHYQPAKNEEERNQLWQARRSISPATFKLKPHKISEDVVVPRSKIPELVAFTGQLGKKLDLIILTFGHAGDGNIHVNIMLDKNDPGELENGMQAKSELFDFVLSLQGTLSGEHGIGITKSDFIGREIDPVALRTMQRLKKLFDPNNILNPGKIFPPGTEKV